jgi:hypothetical protein
MRKKKLAFCVGFPVQKQGLLWKFVEKKGSHPDVTADRTWIGAERT